jgi:hypothetical protein
MVHVATSLVAALVEKLDQLIAGCTHTGEVEGKVRDLADQHPVNAGTVFTLLEPLSWDRLWAVLDQLARHGPTLDGMTYLELVQEAADQHPNLDIRLHTAILAVVLARGGRTLDAPGVPKAERFALSLSACTPTDQVAISEHLGISGVEADGFLSSLFATAVEAGVAAYASGTLAAIAGIPFGDFDLPGNQPYNLYMGRAAHFAIAGYYRALHIHPQSIVATNETPVASIVVGIADLWPVDAPMLATELEAKGKPDIFEFSPDAHPGAGLVYEIKSQAGLAEAVSEAEEYAHVFAMANVPCVPGPPGFLGTFGALPGPNGWFRFLSPEPGAIVYEYIRAPQVQIDARDAQRGRARQRRRYVRALEALGVTAAVAPLVAEVLIVLAEIGWVITLAV